MTKTQLKVLHEVLFLGDVMCSKASAARWRALTALVEMGVLEMDHPDTGVRVYEPFLFRLASRAYERKRPTITAE